MEKFTHLFSSTFLSAAGWTVLHSLWMGAVVLLVAILAQQVLAKNNSAKKYWIAFGAQLTLFVLAIATFVFYFTQGNQQSISEVLFNGNANNGTTALTDLTFDVKAFLAQHTQTVAMIWMAGVAFLFAKMAVGYRYIHHMRQNSWLLDDTAISKLSQTIQDKLNISIPFEIRTTTHYVTPLLTGLYRPFVLLPLAVINSLSVEQVEFILTHELAHLKRYDHWAIFIQQTIETLLYFNPSVWMLSQQINNHREEACDDLVIDALGKQMDYAKSLVKLQELKTAQPQSRLALSAMGTKNELLNRIKRIMNMENNNRYNFGRLSLILLVPCAMVLLSFYSKHEAKKKQVEKISAIVSFVDQGDVVVQVDTVPVPRSKSRIIEKVIKKENGKEIEAEFEGGEIQYLKIDGQNVDVETSEEYEEVVEQLKEELSNNGHVSRQSSRFHFMDDEGNVQSHEMEFDFDFEDLGEGIGELFEGLGDNMEGLFDNLGDNMEGLFDDFEAYDTENGKVFKLDGNTILEWSGGDNGRFHFNFDTDNFDVEGLLDDINFSEEDLERSLKELESVMPEIKERDRQIIIKRSGDEDVIIELDEIEEWGERFSKDAEKWAESFSAEMEEWAHEFEKDAYKMEKRSDAMKSRKHEWKEDLKRREAARKDAMRQMQEARKEQSRELRRRLERVETERDNSSDRLFDVLSKRGTLQGRIEKELRRDGLMSDGDSYTFKLKENRLKINGKKQSNAMYLKYKDIYERYTGGEIKGSSYATSNTGI